MPAARYWRIVGIETYGGGDLELSEVALYDGVTRVDGSATLTSTFAPIAGSLANLKDDDTGTTARFAAADARSPGFALMWDFGADQNVSNLRFAAASQALFTASFTVQSSADAMAWVGLSKLDGVVFPGAGVSTEPLWLEEPSPPLTDTFEAQVLLRLRMNDAVGATTLVDTSPSPKTVTVTAPSGISTFSRHGSGSFHRNETGNATFSDPAAFSFGTGDFTIEFWIFRVLNNNAFPVAVARNDTQSRGWYLEVGDTNGLRMFSYTPSMNFGTASGTAPANTWQHMAICRGSGVIRAYVNGKMLASAANTTNLSTADVVAGQIGGFPGYSTTHAFFIDDLRITAAARYGASDFTPPDATFFPSTAYTGSNPLRQASATPTTISEYPVPAFSVKSAEPISIDETFGGTATIVGTVKEYSLPRNLPLRRRVRLYDERGRMFAREVWSDPVTGLFAFPNMRSDIKWTAMVYDHLGQFQALIIDGVDAV
jgi:hypothetical protein